MCKFTDLVATGVEERGEWGEGWRGELLRAYLHGSGAGGLNCLKGALQLVDYPYSTILLYYST